MRPASTGVKLGLAFGTLGVLLFGIGWLALSRMSDINADRAEIFNRYWSKVELAREVELYSNQNERIANELFFMGRRHDVQRLLKRRNENVI